MRILLLILSAMFLLTGCITHQVGVEQSQLAYDDAKKRRAGKTLNFEVTGAERLTGKSEFTSNTCGAHEFVFDYGAKSWNATRDAFSRSFTLAQPNAANTFTAKLEFLGFNNPMHCKLSGLGITCTGEAMIAAKLHLRAPDGTQVMKKLYQSSGRDDGTFTMTCNAPKEESPKNYKLAFRKILHEAIEETDKFMGIGTDTPAPVVQNQAAPVPAPTMIKKQPPPKKDVPLEDEVLESPFM